MFVENQSTYENGESNSASFKETQSQLSTSIWNELKSLSESAKQAVCKSDETLQQNGFAKLDLSLDSLYGEALGKSAKQERPRLDGALGMPGLSLDSLFGEAASKSLKNENIGLPPQELPTTPNPLELKSDNTGKAPKDKGTAEKGSDKSRDNEPYGETKPFKGEEINRDVEPSVHTVKASDNLTKIAKEHLGPDATAQEVHKHVQEIAKLNNIKNPNLILDGQELKLPGHSADGGTIITSATGDRITSWQEGTLRVDRADKKGYLKTADGSELHWGPKTTDYFSVAITADGGRAVTDHQGNITTSWQDGVRRQENIDGTGSVRRPNEGGGYSEHHWGLKAENNYEIVKSPDGKYLIGEKEGDKVGREASTDAEKLQVEKARLNDKMQERLADNPEALERVKEDMKTFEKRAAQQKPPLSNEEVAKTYAEISKLLESKGEVPVSQSDRLKIAEQVLHQSAHPDEVRQGYHNTCNVTTIESRLYTKSPSDAARLVTEATTTGQVTMADGRVVQIPAGSLQPDSQAIHHPSPDNERSHASQIFQVAAVNDYYDRINRSTTPAGQIRYEQVLPAGPNDTGERLFNYGTTPRSAATDAAGNPLSPPDIPTSELENISNNISGNNEKGIVLINGMYGDKNTVKFKNEEELGDKLAELKKQGKLPAIIWVDAQNEPFFTDSGAGTNGGSGGAHVVTITDYDPTTGNVQMDNQWDQADDHAVSLHDLYLATRPSTNPETIKALEKDVAWDSFFGGEDGMKEFEVLRLKRNASQMTDAEYDAAITKTMKEMQKRWNEDGETYAGEKQRALSKYNQMLGFMPAARAKAIRDAVKAS